jgi:methionyl-tRNA formyltransferase
MSKLTIGFFGSDLTLPILESMVYKSDIFTVTLVVTQPNPVLRGKTLKSKLVLFCEKHGINLYQPEKLRSESDNAAMMFSKLFEMGVVASYGQIIPEIILNSVAYGFINWHPSLLPLYRGATPLQTAIANGDTLTGVTWIIMDKGMDSGDILLQEKIAILQNDTVNELSKKALDTGIHTLVYATDMVKNGLDEFLSTHHFATTQDHEQATATKMLKKEDGFVVLTELTASEINNQRRAYAWFPKTFVELEKFGKVRIDLCDTKTPGFEVICKGNTKLYIQKITLNDGKQVVF